MTPIAMRSISRIRSHAARLVAVLIGVTVGPWCLSLGDRAHAQEDPPPAVSWTLVSVDAKLDDEGRYRVTETHDVTIRSDVLTLTHTVGLGTDQSVVFESLTQVEPDGTETPLVLGDAAVLGQYEDLGDMLRWAYKESGAPFLQPISLRFRIRYELVGALAPAWDLPAGPGVLDPMSGSYQNPLDRLPQALAIWSEASPGLTRHWRLDHDFLFPDRDGSAYALEQIDYRVEYGRAWRLVDPERDIGIATAGVDYRVQRTFEYLPPGAPSAVPVLPAATRMGALVALPVAGLLFWLIFVLVELLPRRGRRPADATFFGEAVVTLPPEVVARLVLRAPGEVDFSKLAVRLVAERKLSVQLLDESESGGHALVRMRLLVDPATLHPFERASLEPIFDGAREVATDELQRRHAGRSFDPDAIVAAAWEAHAPAPPREKRPITAFVAWVLGAAGLCFGVRDVVSRNREPFALMASALAASMAHRLTPVEWWWGRRTFAWSLLLLVPLAVFVAIGTAIHLWPDRPLGPDAALCATLILLAAYQALLATVPPARSEIARRKDDVLRARRFAAAELRKPHPQLRDAWVPHLEALDLGAALERFRTERASQPLGRDRAGVDAEVRIEAPFTGRAPSPPSLPKGWEDGFSVPPGRTRRRRDEQDEDDEETAAEDDETKA